MHPVREIVHWVCLVVYLPRISFAHLLPFPPTRNARNWSHIAGLSPPAPTAARALFLHGEKNSALFVLLGAATSSPNEDPPKEIVGATPNAARLVRIR